MVLITIFICLGLQRYLSLYRYGYQLHLLDHYYSWILTHYFKKMAQVKTISSEHGLFGVILLVFPVLIILVIAFEILFHAVGGLSYLILSILFYWISIDGRDLLKDSYTNIAPIELFSISYQRFFAVTFLFVVFALLGLAPIWIIYPIIVSLRNYLEKIQDQVTYNDILRYTIKIQGVLDWIPIRLMGLSYALAGHFSPVFKLWHEQLWCQVESSPERINAWGLAAAGKTSATALSLEEADLIIERSLILWLIIIALLAFGMYLGSD